MNDFRLILSALFPSVNLKRALFNIRLKSDSNCIPVLNSILLTNYSFEESWITVREPGLGLQIVVFLGQMSVWWIILISIENRREMQRWFEKKTPEDEPWDDSVGAKENPEERIFPFFLFQHLDEDVRTERQLILHENIDSVIVVRDLVRIFHKRLFRQPSRAVDHLNFQVTKRSCFGLLGNVAIERERFSHRSFPGTNGAGKTTTFRMLINDLQATSGEIFLNRRNLHKMVNCLDMCLSLTFSIIVVAKRS